MASTQECLDAILAQISSLPNLRARKMFGEYAIYCDDKVVGLLCDNQLFVKKTDAGGAFAGEDYEEGAPYSGAKPALLIHDTDLEQRQWITELIRITAAALPPPKPKAPRKKKPTSKKSS